MGFEYFIVSFAAALAGIGTGLVGLSAVTAMVTLLTLMTLKWDTVKLSIARFATFLTTIALGWLIFLHINSIYAAAFQMESRVCLAASGIYHPRKSAGLLCSHQRIK